MPWCLRKCPYCDFNSYPLVGDMPQQDYVNALLADLEQDLPKVRGRVVNSIFIGGGTPSLFSPNAIAELLSGIQARITVSPLAEITLEANPGAVEMTRLQEFRTIGINRLSLGIQSFDQEMLQKLGRIHGRAEAIAAVTRLHQVGFDNFNLDMMFGLPQQTVAMALADLCLALDLQPPHFSWYQLTLEPNTPFAKQPPTGLPEDEQLWDMQLAGQHYLQKQGYEHYEISAYAKSGHRCQHNLNYWQFGDYLGIGAGAHGKITDAVRGTITRLSKPYQPVSYLQTASSQAVFASCTTLTVADVVLEFMMNALRLVDGFSSQQFAANTGLNPAAVEATIREADERGWLVLTVFEPGRWQVRASEIGRQFLNELLELFVP